MTARGAARVLAGLVLAAGATAAQIDRLGVARFELAGPCAGAELHAGPAGITRVEAALLPGERRELELPVSRLARPAGVTGGAGAGGLAPPPLAVLVVDADTPGGGRVRFVEWVEDDRAERWQRRSPLERAWRPGPPGGAPSPGIAALALLVAATALGLAWRRRPLAVLAVGAAAGVLLGVGPLVPEPARLELRVLEGGLDAGDPEPWLELRAARSRLAVEPERVLRVEARPDAATLDWRVTLGGAADAWEARAAGTTLYAFAELERRGTVTPERNDLADLEACWLRDAGGAWTALGPWPRGTGLPSPPPNEVSGEGTEASAPPGWLASGLPQGTHVLLARVAGEPAAATAPTGPGAREPGSWLRLVGHWNAAHGDPRGGKRD